MKERPILFSAPMVRALLAGTKTQTRRLMKPQLVHGMVCGLFPSWYLPTSADGGILWPNGKEQILAKCPMGVPGDRLWVRETFQPLLAEGFDFRDANWETGKGYAPRYVATDGAAEWIDPDDNVSSASKPSIHMPRWASRITLDITDVRVERLHSISEADALAEGVDREPVANYTRSGVERPAAFAFRDLWISINGPASWEQNPWLWAIEFPRLGGAP